MSTSKILFLGDLHADSGLPSSWLGPNISNLIQAHRYVSCNIEGPLFSSSKPSNKVGPHISQPKSIITKCTNVGINIFNLGNNHLFDFGRVGVDETVRTISKNGGKFLGVGTDTRSSYRPLVTKLGNLTVSMISGCEEEFGVKRSVNDTKGVAWINDPEIDLMIIKAKKLGQFVVIQSHAGEEASLPLPEWRSRYKYYIDLGADIIISHHSHAPQGWEKYKGKMIYYSIGNFYFRRTDIPSSNKGYAVSLEITNKDEYTTQVFPFRRINNQVEIDEGIMSELIESSNIISSPKYVELANDQALSLWKKYYSKYYASSISCNPLKRFSGNMFNYGMILHNQQIESHRWTINRALNQLYGEEL